MHLHGRSDRPSRRSRATRVGSVELSVVLVGQGDRLEHAEHDAALSLSQTAPEPQKGKFVGVINELTLIWAAWRRRSLEREAKDAGHSLQIGAGGDCFTLLPLSDGATSHADASCKGALR